MAPSSRGGSSQSHLTCACDGTGVSLFVDRLRPWAELTVARETKDKALLQTAGLGLAPVLWLHHGFDPGRCSRNCIVLQEV